MNIVHVPLRDLPRFVLAVSLVAGCAQALAADKPVAKTPGEAKVLGDKAAEKYAGDKKKEDATAVGELPTTPKLNDARFRVQSWTTLSPEDRYRTLDRSFGQFLVELAARPGGATAVAEICKELAAAFKLPVNVEGCAKRDRAVQADRDPPAEEEITKATEKAMQQGDPKKPAVIARPAVGWEQAALEGLADFIAERTKSELRQWAVTGMLEEVCPEDTRNAVSRTLAPMSFGLLDHPPSAMDYLPETCSLSRQFSYGLPNADSMFVKSLRSDLKALPAYLIWISSLSSDEAPPKDWGYVLTNYFDGLQRGGKPLAMAAGLPDNPAVKESTRPECNVGGKDNKLGKDGKVAPGHGYCAVFWAGIAARAYMLAGDLGPRTSRETLVRILAGLDAALTEYIDTTPAKTAAEGANPAVPHNSVAVAIATRGVLRERVPVLLARKTDLEGKAAKLTARVSGVRRMVDEFERALFDLGARQQSAEAADRNKAILASAARVAELAAQTVREAIGLIEIFDVEVSDQFEKVLTRVEVIAGAAGAVAAGQYTDALNRVSVVLVCVSREPKKAKPEEVTLEEARLEATCEDWPRANFKKNSRADKTLRLFVRHLPMIIGMADAKTAKDFQTVLDNSASPVGAWRLKRDRSMWTVSSFVGIQAGYERLSGSGVKTYSGMEGGFFAPVGLDYSRPTSGNRNAHGLLFSIIDIGNLVSTRLTGKDSGQASNTSTELKFSNVLSPGAYYHHGFRNSPALWGFGVAYTPEMRKAQVAGQGTRDVNSLRVVGFVAIDITIFAF